MAIFESLFATLNAAGIRYVVVGGVAVVLHGHARFTADLDLIIDLEPAATRQAIDTLLEAGFVPQLPVRAEEFADPEVRERWIQEKGMRVFSLWNPSQPMAVVDLFADEVIPFEDLWARSVLTDLGKIQVRIASVADLIRLKQEAGRPQDLTDIERLQRIQEFKGGTT